MSLMPISDSKSLPQSSNCLCLTDASLNVKEGIRMQAIRTSRLFTVIGIAIFCVFAGDIVADSIADLRGEHCTSQCSQSERQHEKAPCSHCSCAVHLGTVITSTAAVQITGTLQVSIFSTASDQSALTGPPAAIDHPPQLA